MNLAMFPILLLTATILFSFTPKTASRSAVTASAEKLTQLRLDTGGRTVSLDSAQQCIDRFATLMKAHGFTNQAGQSINIHIKKSSLITTGEAFDGEKLQAWLNETAAQYTASGKKLMIKVQLGVYGNDYLNTYQSDAALRTANKDRIAIFIIPYEASTGVSMRAVAVPNGGGTLPPGSGFDLGGVQP